MCEVCIVNKKKKKKNSLNIYKIYIYIIFNNTIYDLFKFQHIIDS